MSSPPEHARVVDDSRQPTARLDGSCIANTLAALEHGTASSKPMARQALEGTRKQVENLLSEVLCAYERDVASNEVGATGTGRATNSAPRQKRCTTGLLYGRIQSGKTVAMITFAALAIDNGFRVVVVLTSDSVKLVEQTAERFRALDSIVKSSTESKATWSADARHIRTSLGDTGLVIVCAKNQLHLANLSEFLEQIGAAEFPALIMDDEADQATPDTTLNARKAGRKNAPKLPSKINRLMVENDSRADDGPALREILRHHVFLQVTATPYSLLLQNSDSPLRPKFTALLQPGAGYTGGESFFSAEHLENEAPPLVFVAEEESDELQDSETPTPGLVEALAFFLVSASAQAVLEPAARGRSQNFLCHTSQKRAEHERLAELIRGYLAGVGEAIRKPELTGVTAIELGKAHARLSQTVPNSPPLAALCADLRQRLPRRNVVVVNSSEGGQAEVPHGISFLVGGNILGRGLTIENLLVTYYLRSAKVSQMDTMLQHARMFGYRGSLMQYTRVFLPERLALRFHRIHAAEHNLRELLADPERRKRIAVQVGAELRATRNGVLDMSKIQAYAPGEHIFPWAAATHSTAHREHERAKRAVMELGGRFTSRGESHATVEISLEDMERLIKSVPYDDSEEDRWDPKAIVGLLHANRQRFEGKGYLYCRHMTRKAVTQGLTGALNGEETRKLRRLGRPVMCVFLDSAGLYQPRKGFRYEHEYTYPAMVLPDDEDMPVHVFNAAD